MEFKDIVEIKKEIQDNKFDIKNLNEEQINDKRILIEIIEELQKRYGENLVFELFQNKEINILTDEHARQTEDRCNLCNTYKVFGKEWEE